MELCFPSKGILFGKLETASYFKYFTKVGVVSKLMSDHHPEFAAKIKTFFQTYSIQEKSFAPSCLEQYGMNQIF
jgi:hypothetical protein